MAMPLVTVGGDQDNVTDVSPETAVNNETPEVMAGCGELPERGWTGTVAGMIDA